MQRTYKLKGLCRCGRAIIKANAIGMHPRVTFFPFYHLVLTHPPVSRCSKSGLVLQIFSRIRHNVTDDAWDIIFVV